MDSIVAQIQNLVKTADEGERMNILKTLRQVQLDLQSPKDVLMEFINSVRDHARILSYPPY